MALLCSPWTDAFQALTAVAGTFLLAFGLKTVRESGGFDTLKPHPLSSRFWLGLIVVSIAALPTLLRAFAGGCVGALPASASVLGGTVIGFISGWLLSEVTEFRRRLVQTTSYRRALRAELRFAELTLSATFFGLAVGTEDVGRATSEFRWLITEGRNRGWLEGFMKEINRDQNFLKELLKKPDDELKEILKGFEPGGLDFALDVPLPIVNSVLSGQGIGLSSGELESLSELKWEMSMLAREGARVAAEAERASDPHNPVDQYIGKQKLETLQAIYRTRLASSLDSVRKVLRKLAEASDLKGFFKAKQHEG